MIQNRFNSIEDDEDELDSKEPSTSKTKTVLEEIEIPTDSGAPRWIMLYADLMSVVLIFFILLFSMSSFNKAAYQASVKSMQDALLTKKQLSEVEPRKNKLLEIKQKLDQQLAQSEMREYIETSFDQTGIKITVKDSVFFRSGRAELLATSVPILNTIAHALKNQHYPVMVEGHTDNIPIATEKYPSNWELSASRASSVVKYLIYYGQLDPRLVSATGFAEYRPIVANTSESNRAKNRRVEIKIIDN